MKIELTETEIIHIMDALRMRVQDLRETNEIHLDPETADLAHELEELEHDLFEASARRDDPDWALDREPTEIAEGFSFSVTENDFIDAGMQAREQMKANSMAAARRTMRFGEFTVEKSITEERSEQQRVDVWDDADPKNW
jgi:hypothetical protein